ncbi:hypothetical protein QMK33_20930 [Hymenobacter sp. H14-R3]|uniref:hypothetical protein n=1 Tax=Hymenobacter sp. H14-R3 TaxID=3046308 RepID=UPI0024B90E82|nr:hypothetical protein [Hymenobacter sp. H14-R3]MDJ0367618.1 hypothetical protein [Hymenobacter sp. H14-R3]
MSNSSSPTRPAGYDPDAALLALRPAIAGQPAAIPTPATVADFQHQVLRPVLKLQHAVLLATVADFAHDYHLPLATADPTEATRFLTELLARNTRLRATLVGLVVGLLTQPELAFYRLHRAELNRRLLDLAEQRVLTSLDGLPAHPPS